MKKNKFKVFLTLLIILIFNSNLVLAGVANSNGSSTGGGGNGGSSTSAFKMGSDYSSGLNWNYFKGNKTITTSLPFAKQYGGSAVVANGTKGAHVLKHSNGRGWEFFRWQWWYGLAGLRDPSRYVNLGFYDHVWQELDGKLKDPELVKEATKNGFNYNSTKQLYEASNGQKVDAVWITGVQKSSSDTKKVIVYAEIGGKILLKDRSNESANTLYEKPTMSVPYNGQSEPGEMNHKKTIKATYMTVTKKTTYTTDGNKKWNMKYSYSKGGKTYDSRDINYSVIQPDVEQVYFRPFDLNRNGVANDNDVKLSYPQYKATTNLKMSVDNNQYITNGDLLKTLDTNNALRFKINFQNKQFGVPDYSEGGVDLNQEAPGNNFKIKNNYYSPNVINSIGVNGNIQTGKFWSKNLAEQKIKGNISKDTYWAGSMKSSISTNTASLTYLGDEKIGGDVFSFTRGWTGGEFDFKTTKIGTYKLTSNGRDWWEMQYEKGKFYGYGVSYSGIINNSNIGIPKINETNLYYGLASRNLVQPILKGTFEAKTIGGNIG